MASGHVNRANRPNTWLHRPMLRTRLEREAGRNVEVMWLTCRLISDHKTVADFRKDSGPAIKQVCVQFIELCRQMGLLATASIAIDGSKFKSRQHPRQELHAPGLAVDADGTSAEDRYCRRAA
jgi:hypothetical protein